MAETKSSNGVSSNKKKSVKSTSVTEVPMEEINKHIVEFTDGKELFVDYISFEPTSERIATQEDTGNNGDTANSSASKPTKAGDYINADESGSKALADVLKACVVLKAKNTKSKENEKDNKKEQDGPNKDDDAQK